MREIFLCKYGELILKGANRSSFESILVKDLRYRLFRTGCYRVYRNQSIIYVVPEDGCEPDDDARRAAWEIIGRTFGIVAASRCVETEKSLPAICSAGVSYLADRLSRVRTFKVETKRADKRFPVHSSDVSAELGAALLGAFPNLRVDVHDPDVVVKCEIREGGAYISAGQERTAGGMPVGSNGRGLLLLSGGIDSPVAGWLMAKRGLRLSAVYFEAFPYTSLQAREKVISLARELSLWTGSIDLHIVSLTGIEEAISRACDEAYFTLLLRRSMMRIADRLAGAEGCGALITGESLGQVASQTMEALAVTGAVPQRPVFRPCIGLDKEEIIAYARRIGTFETSILPYEDCCTVFTPRHPRTRPKAEGVKAEELKAALGPLEDEALQTAQTVRVRFADTGV
jgi:thiamine biosynthesis protein ThiI